MPSKHKGHPTIAFRPSSPWQYSLIEERAKLSGLYKKDFMYEAVFSVTFVWLAKKRILNALLIP